GVLPVLLGRATRLSRWITGHRKRYRFELRLGASTDTGDCDGILTETGDFSGIGRDDLETAAAGLTGRFGQRVPEYSAVRLEGVRAYSRARKGIGQEMPLRQVEAYDWMIGPLEDARATIEVTVSSGAYVRALARDLGEILGCHAHAASIIRTAVGGFTVEMCSREPDEPSSLIGMAEAMSGYAAVTLSERDAQAVRTGMPVPSDLSGTVALLDPASSGLLAVGEGDGMRIRPLAVFP
ncbi:hypothetical protein GX411_11085, partial [Candidatus Fermentibacteria bacterium]|nr:hypothetical protein [Candidatus Fermentibacteria bacterium]